MINSIDLLRLRNSEFMQFCYHFTTIVNTHNPTTLSVKPQYDSMMLKYTELDALFRTATNNPITAEIEALDVRRDRAINGIMGWIKNSTYHYDPDMVEAATVLQNNLNLYNTNTGIAQENYLGETASVKSLISDWQTKPELQNAVDILGILDWVMELKTANDEFDVKYLERNIEYGSASSENMKSKRTETMTAYYALRNRLNAHWEIEGTPLYTTTMNELNAIIEQYNTVLRGRTTVTENAETISPN